MERTRTSLYFTTLLLDEKPKRGLELVIRTRYVESDRGLQWFYLIVLFDCSTNQIQKVKSILVGNVCLSEFECCLPLVVVNIFVFEKVFNATMLRLLLFLATFQNFLCLIVLKSWHAHLICLKPSITQAIT